MDVKTESWRGHDIRFVKFDDEWWAILKDICDALNLKTFKVARLLNSYMMEQVFISEGNKLRERLAVNEIGIYELLYASKTLDTSRYRIWEAFIMKKLRERAGLAPYEVMLMAEPEIQDNILDILIKEGK